MNLRKIVFTPAILIMLFLMAGCSPENSARTMPDNYSEIRNGSSEVSEISESENEEGNQNEMKKNDNLTNEGTPVILVMNDEEVKATLNNTLTAQEFIKLLPYSVSVSRAADDLCGSVSEDLPADPAEGKNSWKIGEIGWFGGWFTILVDHEERFANMPSVMIIGKIDAEYIDTVAAFNSRVDITVKLAE